MKNLLFLLVLVPFLSMAQEKPVNEFESPVSFIRNQGQFNNRNWQKKPVQYGIDGNILDVFFTTEGLTYRFDKMIREGEREEGEKHEPGWKNESVLIHVTWIDANPDVQIIAENETSYYYSYGIRDYTTKKVRNINHIKGFKKIIYKNLYDNIDLIYEITQNNNLEYSFVLHPNADVTKIKMRYSTDQTNGLNGYVRYYLDASNNIQIETSLGHIIEGGLQTFYKSSKMPIASYYGFNRNTFSFQLEAYNHSKEVVIDPWVVLETANDSNSSAVWEVETDAIGNVYTISNEDHMQLKKYNSSGSLQWIYNTPWDTNSVWLGTLATDGTGTSYVTSGTSPEIECINTSGSMVWHASGYNSSCEYWSIIFNSDNTKLIVGGTYNPDGFSFDYYSAIYDIDITNGNVLDYQVFDSVDVGELSFPPVTPIEVRSMAATKNSKLVFFTHNYVASINQEFSVCSNMYYQNNFNVPYAYKCENFLPFKQNGGGLKAIIAGDHYFYRHAGDTIFKYSLDNGSLLDSVALTGGHSDTIMGKLVINNSGLDVDSCNNLYVGSGDRIVKFDENLNFIQEVTLPFTVYDVKVNTNGEVIAVGAENNNTDTINRHGHIVSVDMNACAPYVITDNTNAGICSPVDFVCSNDSAFNLVSIDTGGVWSGTGITDSIAGTFNPAVANIGNNTVYYSISGLTDSIIIDVVDCSPLSVCYDSTNLVATTLTATWYETQTDTFSITTEQDCIDCSNATPQYSLGIYTGCDINVCYQNIWVEYATGTTTAPLPSTWPLMVINAYDTLVFDSLQEIPFCNNTFVSTSINNSQIKIYPNPANHQLFVEYNHPFTMEISDIAGKLILKSETKETDISKIKPGVYIVSVKNKNGLLLKTEKLVVQ